MDRGMVNLMLSPRLRGTVLLFSVGLGVQGGDLTEQEVDGESVFLNWDVALFEAVFRTCYVLSLGVDARCQRGMHERRDETQVRGTGR